jgi:hypothetical protein
VKKNHKQSLENKACYRLFRVIFVVAILSSFLFGLGLFFDIAPYKIVYEAIITCDNGKIFNGREAGLYINAEVLSNADREKIIIACDAGTEHVLKNKKTGKIRRFTTEELNQADLRKEDIIGYKVDYKSTTEGSWTMAVLSGIAATLVGVLLVIMVKKTLLYILIGGNWWKL